MTPADPTSPDSDPAATDTRLTRRASFGAALAAAGSMAAAPMMIAGAAVAQEAAPGTPAAPSGPFAPWYRFGLGGFEVTVLLAGTGRVEKPQGTFGLNATPEAFAAASAAAFLPADDAISYYTPVVVRTGQAVVLFDTGLKAAGLLGAMQAAGIDPASITHVVLTHMHGDHIGGLSEGGTLTFPNATNVMGRIEFDHWAGAGNEGFESKIRPLADKATFLADGDSVVPGITAELAPGHTPGHMIFHLDSQGAKLVLTADTANHYVWSLGYPEWEVRFDNDKAQGIATRKKVLAALAESRTPFIGYHMPFPALGYVEALAENPAGASYRFVPASYQLLLPVDA